MKAVVRGKVQGVAFRYNAKQVADSFGLVGWVRNNRDGSVEVLVEGNVYEIEQFQAFLQVGKTPARVDGVDFKQCDPGDEFSSFEIIK